MNLQITAAILIALGLVGCSNSSGVTSKGNVTWTYDNASPSGEFEFTCVKSTSRECRAEIFDSASKSLQVVTVNAGQAAKINLPAGATYLLVAPNDALSILAKTNKLQQGEFSGSQDFNKDHA